MTIKDQIRDEKLQYDIDREAALQNHTLFQLMIQLYHHMILYGSERIF